jgi:ribosomal peptide maturation radical SAM protein 1
MPFSALNYPSIGLSLLQPTLRDLGHDCKIRYFSFDFADLIGDEAHQVLTNPHFYRALLGEWVFAGATNTNLDAEVSIGFFEAAKAAGQLTTLSPGAIALAIQAKLAVQSFIDRCAAEISDKFDIVGFTTSFQQNMASLALAKRVKQQAPATKIVFGGANCRADMGLALIEYHEFIDAVCLDEGDRAFPAYVAGLAAGEVKTDIPGMVVRVEGIVSRTTIMNNAITVLDELPDPDFSDFFVQHALSAVGVEYSPAVLIETARGCWWGAKHHCTFCGINGNSMAFRSKSPTRAHEEFIRLAVKYGSDFISVDAILDMKYFDTVLPLIAELGPKVTVYCEVKSNLKPQHLLALARAGFRKVQPGIEALDSSLLRLMRKGCTAIQNIQTLKLAAECGLFIEWNLLFGFPGDSIENYENTARTIRLLHHLQPPQGVGPVSGDRFSPFFENPELFDISLQPVPAYRFMFPFADEAIRRLAYHFLITRNSGECTIALARPAAEAAALWKNHHSNSSLIVEEREGKLRISDLRWGNRRVLTLEGVKAAIYNLCWCIKARAAIHRELTDFAPAALELALSELVEEGVLFRERDEFLSLALRQPGYQRAPTWEQIRAGGQQQYMHSQVRVLPDCDSAPEKHS